MATWKFSDGTTLLSHGVVHGTSPFSNELRKLLQSGPKVRIFPVPMPLTPLDPSSAYMVHLFALHAAKEAGLQVTTEYDPTHVDLPPKLLEELRAFQDDQNQQPFDIVH